MHLVDYLKMNKFYFLKLLLLFEFKIKSSLNLISKFFILISLLGLDFKFS